MIRTGQASTAQATRGHAEVLAVLLNEHIGRNLRGTKEGVRRLIDREGLRDTVLIGRVGVVPPGLEFAQGNPVRCVAVDLVRRHVDERRLGTVLPCGLEQVERPNGIRVEIIEWNRRCAVVAGLSRRMHDCRGSQPLYERRDSAAIANVEFVVHESGQLSLQPRLVPPIVSLRAEEHRTLVVVHPVNGVAETAPEVLRDLGTNQTRRTCDNN